MLPILSGQNSIGLPLKDWLQKIEKSSQYLFNYDPVILSNQAISIPNEIKSPKDILSYISSVTKYQFKYIDNKYVLIHTSGESALYQPIKIKCKVWDANMKEPLAFANIFTEDYVAGCTSEEDGSFVLKGNFNPNQHIIVSYLGYESTKVKISDIGTGNVKTIRLKPIDQFLSDVVITDTRNAFLSSKMEQTTVIKTSNISILAGQAEKDPLALVQLLPGVSAIGESVTNISFRGSTSDQNLVTWNQIPLYHTGHFVGLLSSCNPFVIDEIKVYNDGFKSNYGGRVAGVIEMNSKNRHTNKLAVNANVNLLTANMHTQIPLWKDRITLEASYRTSYGGVFKNIAYQNFFDQSFQSGRIQNIKDYIAVNELQANVFNSSNVSFYDYNLRAMITPSDRDLVAINYIKAKDIVRNDLTFDWSDKHETDTISLYNFGVSSIWSHRFSDIWTSSIAYVYSGFENGYSYFEDINQKISTGYINKSNSVKETKISWENILTFEDVTLEFGYHRNHIDNRSYRITVPSNVYEKDENVQNNGLLDALFLNYTYSADEKFKLDLGIRYSKYNLSGQKFAEPRMTFWHQLNDMWRIKASAGKYTQVLTQIEEYNDVQVEDMYWRLADGKPGNELIPITTNTQYSTGVSYSKKQWKVDLVLFSKKVENITALGLEFDSGLNPWWIATGKSVGIEFSLSKKSKFGHSIINYSHNDMNLDFGSNRIYPAPYNHKHQILCMQTFQYKKWDISLIYKIKTGRPYSVYTSFYISGPNELGDPEAVFVYDKQFDKNLDAYQRLDFTLTYKLWSKPSNKWSAKVGISLLNVLNHPNIIQRSNYVDYSDWPEIKPATFDRKGLGFTPNIFLSFQF